MQKPLRAEIHISILENVVLNELDVRIISLVEDIDKAPQNFSASISANQVFNRLQEITNNQLLTVARKMEDQLRSRKK